MRKSERDNPGQRSLKKDSSNRKETSAARDSFERRRRRKEKKAQALEAELWAERERKEREEDRRLAQEKLLNQLRKEKYSHECPELKAYRKKHIRWSP